MRLSGLVPSISADSVAHLEACGIRTDSDLLFTPTLEIFRKLPPSTLTLQELVHICTTVTELSTVEPVLATELLARTAQESGSDAELEVGDDEIDRLLHGLGCRRIIEISGDKSTGKTVLALNITLDRLLRQTNKTAAWIDTTGDFSPRVAYETLSSLGCENPDDTLERLQVSLAFDVDAVHAVLDELFDPTTGVFPNIVVIDVVTPLLGPMLSAVTSHGHAVTTDFFQRLRALAIDFHSTILVVNNATLKHPYDATTKNLERKPALGPTFTFMTDTTLWLSRLAEQEHQHSGEVFHLEIMKSRTKTAGASCNFSIFGGRLKASDSEA